MSQTPCFDSASLDTNILIHLWRSQTEDMLKQMFTKVYVHQWLLDKELMNHAPELRVKIIDSMADGFVEPINNAILKKQGLYQAFDRELKLLSPFFSDGDTGEGYAIALAKVFGIPAVVTNDTKVEGPKWYLNIRPNEPFGFSSDEVLFINYLKGSISVAEFQDQFQAMNEVNGLNWRIKVCMKRFTKRFLGEPNKTIPASVRDHLWMDEFAQANGINVAERLASLRAAISEEDDSLSLQKPKTQKDWLLSDYPLPCVESKRNAQESYRLAYQILRRDTTARNIQLDAHIARVLEQLKYKSQVIMDTIDERSPMVKNNPIYSQLVYNKRTEYDDVEEIDSCCQEIRQKLGLPKK